MSQNTEYTVDPSRLVSPDAAPADAAEEVSLRPKTLDDYRLVSGALRFMPTGFF